MRKIKHSRIFILGIFIYVIFQGIISISSKNVDTLVLKNENIEAKIKTKGLVIRDEHIVKSDLDGKIKLLVKEGEKVKKSQEVASIYSDKLDENLEENISKLKNEINELKNGKDNISSKDIAVLNENIFENSEKIQLDLLNKNYDKVDEQIKNVSKIIEQRNELLNNDIDSKKLNTKKDQLNILLSKQKDGVCTLKSGISGITSYKFDGKEEKFTFDNISKITKLDIKNTDNQYESVKKSGESIKSDESAIRVIDNYNIYVAISVNKDESKNFDINQNVILRYNNQEIKSKVDKINKDKDDFIIIFKISDQNIGIYDTRVEEFDIIYRQIEGLKIPKSSMETKGKKQGVYVIDEESKAVNFVELNKIAYEDDNFVYIDCYDNEINDIKSVNIYDKIILKPNIINKNMKIK